MSLAANFSISQSPLNGSVISWEDVTGAYNATTNTGGYGAPNITSVSVNATRIIIGNYVDEQAAGVVSSLTAFKEYKLISGTLQYGAITISEAGTLFIPQSDSASLSGSSPVVESTGRVYVYLNPPITDPLTWGVELIYPSQLLFTDTILPDRVFTLAYELYTTQAVQGTNAIVDGTQYIVVGADSNFDYVDYVINGVTNTYVGGEVFIGDTDTDFTDGGTVAVYEFNTSVQKSFVLTYNIENYSQILTALAVTMPLGSKPYAELMQQIAFMNTEIQGVVNAVSPHKLDISGAQALIDHITEDYTRLSNLYA